MLLHLLRRGLSPPPRSGEFSEILSGTSVCKSTSSAASEGPVFLSGGNIHHRNIQFGTTYSALCTPTVVTPSPHPLSQSPLAFVTSRNPYEPRTPRQLCPVVSTLSQHVLASEHAQDIAGAITGATFYFPSGLNGGAIGGEPF